MPQVDQGDQDPFLQPMPDLEEITEEEFTKLVAGAIRKTREAISNVAVRMRVLEKVRVDPTVTDELIMEAARSYREADDRLKQVLNHEIALHKAGIDLAERDANRGT